MGSNFFQNDKNMPTFCSRVKNHLYFSRLFVTQASQEKIVQEPGNMVHAGNHSPLEDEVVG